MSTPFLMFGLIAVAFGVYYCFSVPKQLKTFTEPIDGIICGYEAGWITARIGGRSRRVLGWRAVVTYSVDGATYCHTCDSNAELSEPVIIEPKTIPLFYDPANPGKCVEAVYNDPRSVWGGPVIILFGVVFIVLSFLG